MLEDNNFNWVDWIVLVGTLVFALLIGFYYAFMDKQKTNEDLLLGGRTMSMVPVALSMMATYVSATMVLGTPAEIYNHGTLIFTLVIEMIVFVPISSFVYVPVFYKLRLTSVNEYLELRFNSVVVRWLASATFIIQMTFNMGIVLYAPSLAMQTFLGCPVWLSILVVGGCGTIYTAIGGLRAVVWSDVFQVVVMVAGMLAILIKGLIDVGGFGNAFAIANEHGRLQFVDFSFSPFLRQTTWSLFFGYGILSLCVFSTHQPQVQRYSSMGSLRGAMGAMLLSIPMFVIMFTLGILTGVVIFAVYAGCDPIKTGQIERVDQIIPYFVVEQLSMVKGMMGLFLACLFSASLSTVSSGLNSVAAVTWEDFLVRTNYFKNMAESKQATVTKIVAFSYGILSIGFAFVVVNMGSLLTVAFTVVGVIIGPLGGVFFLGLFIPHVDKWGAAIGMIVSHITTIWICIGGMLIGINHIPMPTSTDLCPNETLAISPEMSVMMPEHVEVEWPEKIYTISYILYAPIGTLVCMVVGSVVSLFTGKNEIPQEKENLFHPGVIKLHYYLQRKLCKRHYKPVNIQIPVDRISSNPYLMNGDYKDEKSDGQEMSKKQLG